MKILGFTLNEIGDDNNVQVLCTLEFASTASARSFIDGLYGARPTQPAETPKAAKAEKAKAEKPAEKKAPSVDDELDALEAPATPSKASGYPVTAEMKEAGRLRDVLGILLKDDKINGSLAAVKKACLSIQAQVPAIASMEDLDTRLDRVIKLLAAGIGD